MTFPDLINALFEGTGAAAAGLNVRQILRDKQARGFHIGSVLFFTSWGGWNVWYYPWLHQYASLVAAATLFAVNLLYTGLVLYYLYRASHKSVGTKETVQPLPGEKATGTVLQGPHTS